MKLLLVDDEERLTRVLSRALAGEGHEVDVCADCATANARVLDTDYDVILLDGCLPDLDGITLLRTWRDDGFTSPVLVLSARGSAADRVDGLRAGADDYLVKPYDFDDLLARIEVLLRRRSADSGATFGPVSLDPKRRALVRGDRAEPLTPLEYQLVAALASHPGEVLSRSSLLDAFVGARFDGSAAVVDASMAYVQTKIDRLGAEGVRIEPVPEAGFRLVAPEGAAR